MRTTNGKPATVKHVKSNRGTALNISNVAQVALQLSRRPDETIDRDVLEQNFQKAFNLMTEYETKLIDFQDEELD